MKKSSLAYAAFACIILFVLLQTSSLQLFAQDKFKTDQTSLKWVQEKIAAPTNLSEARARARLLHETIRGTLQVVHRDFFDEDNASAIPSASLEDVFDELHQGFDVQIKWLVVDTDVVNVDHRAQDAFEKKAVKALAAGKPFTDAVEADRYRFAGTDPFGFAVPQMSRQTANKQRRPNGRPTDLNATRTIVTRSTQPFLQRNLRENPNCIDSTFRLSTCSKLRGNRGQHKRRWWSNCNTMVSAVSENQRKTVFTATHSIRCRNPSKASLDCCKPNQFGTPQLLWQELSEPLADDPFALAALDLAAHDLYGKLVNRPTYQLLGLDWPDPPASNYTIGIDGIDKMVAKMNQRPNWPIYKIKLGTERDVEIVTSLRQHTDAVFRVDANCGWTADEAIENSHSLKKTRRRIHRTTAASRFTSGAAFEIVPAIRPSDRR